MVRTAYLLAFNSTENFKRYAMRTLRLDVYQIARKTPSFRGDVSVLLILQ
jgi:hypothetical protein